MVMSIAELRKASLAGNTDEDSSRERKWEASLSTSFGGSHECGSRRWLRAAVHNALRHHCRRPIIILPAGGQTTQFNQAVGHFERFVTRPLG